MPNYHIPSQDDLGKLVIARTAQGELVAVGKLLSHCESPTVCIEQPDGICRHWRADMCTVIAEEDAADLIISQGRGRHG